MQRPHSVERAASWPTSSRQCQQHSHFTALAACSIPGFLYSWYRPDGRLSADQVVTELSVLAWRVVGLAPPAPGA